MKYIAMLLLLLTITTTVSAEFVGPGATTDVVTVKSIANMKDDVDVTLEGNIIKKTGSEHYIFKDPTGEIEVEIEDENFKGIKVTPQTKVKIRGEVDKEWRSRTIDVDSVELVK